MKIRKLLYITYQTFPAQTANSLQTISNIKYLIRNGIDVDLYFPLRATSSTDNIEELKNFYEFSEDFETIGVKHNYPHGKIKIFPKLWFHLSHFFWSKKLVTKNFKNDRENYFFTRSDWIAFFLAKQGSNVIFECHQTSRVRQFVISKIGELNNVKLIFLNENLKMKFKNTKNSIVIHNAADALLFSNKEDKKENKIIFLGNTSRFDKSRGIGQIISWFTDKNLKENFKLEIVGGSKKDSRELNNMITNLGLSGVVKSSSWVDRKTASQKLSEASYGLLINTPDNEHSYLYTSPLKYFEYLYCGLTVIAVNFPSHKTLPFNEKVSFFQYGNKKSFMNCLEFSKNINTLSENEKYSISLDKRAKKLIEYIF